MVGGIWERMLCFWSVVVRIGLHGRYILRGYVIYRSTDPSFKDVELVPDGRGAKYLRVPLKDAYGRDARFDKVWEVRYLE